MPRLALGLSLSALMVGGCIALSCDEMGCNGTYTLTLEASTWADGEYEMFVAFDGEEAMRCTFTLPLEGGETCGGFPAITMTDGALIVPVPTPMNENLVEAEIVLSQGGTALLSEIVEPAWGEPVWPNGKDCDQGYGCLSAEDSFTL